MAVSDCKKNKEETKNKATATDKVNDQYKWGKTVKKSKD